MSPLPAYPCLQTHLSFSHDAFSSQLSHTFTKPMKILWSWINIFWRNMFVNGGRNGSTILKIQSYQVDQHRLTHCRATIPVIRQVIGQSLLEGATTKLLPWTDLNPRNFNPPYSPHPSHFNVLEKFSSFVRNPFKKNLLII